MKIRKEEELKNKPVSKGWKGDWVSGNLGPDAPRSEVHKQKMLRALYAAIAFVLALLLAQLVENPKPKPGQAISLPSGGRLN